MAHTDDSDIRPARRAGPAGATLTSVAPTTPAPHLRWYREVITTAVFYLVYSAIRNEFGSNAVSPARALTNAHRVIRIEDGQVSYADV